MHWRAFLGPVLILKRGENMEQRTVRDLLAAVAQGEITPEQAETQLRIQPFIDLGYAKLDTGSDLWHCDRNVASR